MLSSLIDNLKPKPKAPDISQRRKTAIDTIARTDDIVAHHASHGATTDSVFISEQLPHLDSLTDLNPGFQPTEVCVINEDAFTMARQIMKEYPDAQVMKTVVLNLASDIFRAGGWETTLSTTQEEALCYSSTLYATLKASYYPWPNIGEGSVAGVYSPGVVLFKDDYAHAYADLPSKEQRVVSVITVAAPRNPKLSKDRLSMASEEALESLRGKIRLVYRMAAHNKQHYLVLGAMGCGAYRCPPRLVAEEMKSILQEPEFAGWFRQITFAVYSSPTDSNFDIFKEVFQNVKI